MSAHCTLPQTSTQNPMRDPSAHPQPVKDRSQSISKSQGWRNIRAEIFYFCFQMVFPWPGGRAQLQLTPHDLNLHFLQMWYVAAENTTRPSLQNVEKREMAALKNTTKHGSEIGWHSLQPIPISSKWAAFIFPVCSSESFSTGGWIGKSSSLEMFSQEGTVQLDALRGNQL